MFIQVSPSSSGLRTSGCPRSDPGRSQRTSTRVAYERDVHRWRQAGGAIPCTADKLLQYMGRMATRVAPLTLARRLMAIQDAHVRAGHLSPTSDRRVRAALRVLASGRYPPGMRQADGDTAPPPRPTAVVDANLLAQLIGQAPRSALDRRDVAILLLCHAGLKRGAVVALNIEHLVFSESAMRVHSLSGPMLTLRATGEPLCAASACRSWIEHSDLAGKTGPLFPRFNRSGEPMPAQRLDGAYVNKILKMRLQAAGVHDVSMYSAESLRKGYTP